ncbi:MAG: glycosyltransferase [Anaerolineae bacterium]|nr:glycosyltransferase [Anaerolineae bacterium]
MSEAAEASLASAAVQFRLATIWQAKGQVERAIAGYEQAIRLQPDYLPAHLELGQLLTHQGRVEEAVTVYRRALVVNPDETALEVRLAELTDQRASPSMELDPKSATGPAETSQDQPHIALYTDCSGIYGAEQWNHTLLMALARDGYRVTAIQPRAAHHLVDAQRQAGIAHVWLADDNLYDLSRPARALTDPLEPRAILSRLRPDLLLFSDGAPMSSLAAKEVALALNLPYVIVVHCATEVWASQYAPYVARLPRVYRHAQAVVSVSQANLALLHDRFGLPPDQGQVILNGRPSPFFAPPDPAARLRLRGAWRIPADALVVCTVGSLERRKGYHYLLQAMRRLGQSAVWPRLYFVWVGRGSQEGQLRAAVDRLGLQGRVRFLGERPDVVDILDAADIFVLPSEYEGMPLSVMEAMARGKPVIATAVSGIPEELGDTGRLLPNPTVNAAGVVDGLVQTLEGWARDEGLRSAVGERGRQRAAMLFTEDRMVAEYRTLIQSALPTEAASGE